MDSRSHVMRAWWTYPTRGSRADFSLVGRPKAQEQQNRTNYSIWKDTMELPVFTLLVTEV
jgi:hypothetical protein